MKLNFKICLVEPKILPLVKAMNATKLVKTFSSCQGHFKGTEQKAQDRNFADVRFEILPNVDEKEVELLLGHIVTRFYEWSCYVLMEAYKSYMGKEGKKTFQNIYVIKLEPADRFEHPKVKRKDMDKAIKATAILVEEWTEKREKDKEQRLKIQTRT